jgi:response regulator RpfG family c-di-GMP phosphodiesterase
MQPYVIMLQTDPDDRYITESALAETGFDIVIKFLDHIDDLDTCLAENGLPVVILLNVSGLLNKGGHNIVRLLKTHPSCSHIPVVVLGEVSANDYIKDWYKAGVNTFIVKPSSVAATRKKIKTFLEYWFDVAEVKV